MLVSIDAGKPTPVTLADWERMTLREMAPQAPAARNMPPPAAELTRADVVDGVVHLQAQLAWMQTAVEGCQGVLAAIDEFLRARLAALAPNFGKLGATLEAACRVLAQLHDSVEQAAPYVAPLQEAGERSVPAAADTDPRDASVECRIGAGPLWRNRKDAYATLDALADYLADLEPHSPTPFLIRRAANWGRMSLPEVIAEIIREEGDVNRLLNVLGVKQ